MQRLTRFVVAPLFVLGGLWFLAMPFAFATMLDGDPNSPMTWREYLGAVWSGGATAFVLGLGLLVAGVYLASLRDRSESCRQPEANCGLRPIDPLRSGEIARRETVARDASCGSNELEACQ